MKVRLLAPDSVAPNVAIMRISSYHKLKGDDVAWFNQEEDFTDTDILYISKVFTFSKYEEPMLMNNCQIIRGGTGYDIKSKLPDEIESITDLDYSLYEQFDYSMMFTTRGCIRQCPFCLVREKEGLIHDVPLTSLNPKGKYIRIQDNNFFASKTWKERLEKLKELNQPLEFTGGLDLRILTAEQCEALSKCNIRGVKVAFDNYEDKEIIMPKVKMLAQYISPYKITCYILVGFKQKEIAEEDLKRIELIASVGALPYVMVYRDLHDASYQPARSTKRLARWCNNRWLYKTNTWEEYKKSRGNLI